MALLPINFDVVTGQLVFSQNNLRVFQLPPLLQEDNITIDFRAFKRVRETIPPFFETITLSGYQLVISLGEPATPIANASSWTLGDSNRLLTGRLDLATSGVDALDDGAQTRFEVRLFDGTGYHSGQTVCTVKKKVATVGSLNPVVNDTALGKLEAARTYMKKEGAAGEGFILRSEDGLQRVLCYLHNDGSVRWEPIS